MFECHLLVHQRLVPARDQAESLWIVLLHLAAEVTSYKRIERGIIKTIIQDAVIENYTQATRDEPVAGSLCMGTRARSPPLI